MSNNSKAVDLLHLGQSEPLKSALRNIVGPLNGILGLGFKPTGIYAQYGNLDVLSLQPIDYAPSNPQLGMIVRPDGKGFDPLNDGGLKLVTWDVDTETWVELGAGGSGGGASIVYAFRANKAVASGNQTTTAGAYTKITFDEGYEYDPSVLSQYSFLTSTYTAQSDSEVVLFYACLYHLANGTGNRSAVALYKNGALHSYGAQSCPGANKQTNKVVMSTIDLDAGDTVECYDWIEGTPCTVYAGPTWTYFGGIRLV